MKDKMLGKRIAVIGGILVLFLAAVAINAGKNKQKKAAENADDGSVATANNIDYYTAFRETRNSTREREMEYLESILSNESTDDETQKEVFEQKTAIVECMEKELLIESQIKAKGFSDCAVTFHKGSCNIIVDADELTDAQTAQILDIAMRETGEPAENIKVSLRR